MNCDNSEMIFSKGINFKELFNGGTEFHIDVNNIETEKNLDPLLYSEEDILNDDFLNEEGSETENDLADALRNLEVSAQLNKLSTPEYNSFKELGDTMVDCVSSGDVKILIIEEGDGPLVPIDAVVSIQYAAYWEKEVVPFDATSCNMPKTFRMGTDLFLPGLEVGISMVHGPTARFCLLLTPKAAWGPLGVLPKIRPETVLFVVHLVEVRDVGAVERFNDLPSEVQRKFETTVKTVTASNLQAKEAFAKEKFKKALKHYHKSLSVLQLCSPETVEEKDQQQKMLVTVYLNLAVCYFRLDDPNKILLMCDQLARVTDVNGNAKCLFYYAKAFKMLGDYEKSLVYFKRALRLVPRNKDVGRAIAELDEVLKNDQLTEKRLFRGMFGCKSGFESELDEDLKRSFEEMIEELSRVEGSKRIELPENMSRAEVDYVRRLVDGYGNLIFFDNYGKKTFIAKK